MARRARQRGQGLPHGHFHREGRPPIRYIVRVPKQNDTRRRHVYRSASGGHIWRLAALMKLDRLSPLLRRQGATTKFLQYRCPIDEGRHTLVALAVESFGRKGRNRTRRPAGSGHRRRNGPGVLIDERRLQEELTFQLVSATTQVATSRWVHRYIYAELGRWRTIYQCLEIGVGIFISEPCWRFCLEVSAWAVPKKAKNARNPK